MVAPNADTLYSIAELKLKPQPIVIHVPLRTGTASTWSRCSRPTPRTSPRSAVRPRACWRPATTSIAGPGKYSATEEVDGMKVIHSPYNQVWLIARTVVKDPADLPTARAIQAEEKLVPLKKWNSRRPRLRTADLGRKTRRPTCAHDPGHDARRRPAPLLEGARQGAEAVPAAGRRRAAARKLAAAAHRPGHASDARATSAPQPSRGCAKRSTVGPGQVLADVKASIVKRASPRTTDGSSQRLGDYGTNYSSGPSGPARASGRRRRTSSIYRSP